MIQFPLQATKVEVKEVDFNPEFVSRMIPKIDWSALRQAANDVNGLFYLLKYMYSQIIKICPSL